jgi:hypothetical protein
MIKVLWPLASMDQDNEVCDWLEELVEQSPGEIVFEFRDSTVLFFKKDEDAVAFKLRFDFSV